MSILLYRHIYWAFISRMYSTFRILLVYDAQNVCTSVNDSHIMVEYFHDVGNKVSVQFYHYYISRYC
jgi:hypothetical protein